MSNKIIESLFTSDAPITGAIEHGKYAVELAPMLNSRGVDRFANDKDWEPIIPGIYYNGNVREGSTATYGTYVVTFKISEGSYAGTIVPAYVYSFAMVNTKGTGFIQGIMAQRKLKAVMGRELLEELTANPKFTVYYGETWYKDKATEEYKAHDMWATDPAAFQAKPENTESHVQHAVDII